jgi:hypothetical protein
MLLKIFYYIELNILFYRANYSFYRTNILFIDQTLSNKYFLYRAYKFHRFRNNIKLKFFRTSKGKTQISIHLRFRIYEKLESFLMEVNPIFVNVSTKVRCSLN